MVAFLGKGVDCAVAGLGIKGFPGGGATPAGGGATPAGGVTIAAVGIIFFNDDSSSKVRLS